MEQTEAWKQFLNKPIKVIQKDLGRQFPIKKIGICEGITETHLILRRTEPSNANKTEAINFSEIQRVELIDEVNPGSPAITGGSE